MSWDRGGSTDRNDSGPSGIAHHPEGGRGQVHVVIAVKVDQVGDNVRIAVKDNGFGIEAKYLGKIFDRFYRVKNEKTRFLTGTGLGLPIVKGLVDSLGGSISVESEPGRGSTFTVLIPVQR